MRDDRRIGIGEVVLGALQYPLLLVIRPLPWRAATRSLSCLGLVLGAPVEHLGALSLDLLRPFAAPLEQRLDPPRPAGRVGEILRQLIPPALPELRVLPRVSLSCLIEKP